ncbi:MAG: tRNA (adenosine(37)-N6)-threonylcarbamoyltransferase complex ATPase subunit type 1 TsaE, partial [Bacteroidia bacterium]|nr:tRNA (adenosine(37)-N6)-threonylcarbamoyltransferase complex ATPase subunit type 1 TsaE [Bacteroidia bacterium]
MKQFEELKENEIQKVIDFLLETDLRVLLFSGEVGTGKTTLIRDLVHHMGSFSEVSSPTFSLLNEYQTEKGMIYHSDWYRVKLVEELYDAGIMEYFNMPGLFIIEWPEVGL